MSKELSRKLALDDISDWDTEGVLRLLRKNGLEECCTAVGKRQIDGDELLHLTDGKLALWKNDLTRPLIGKLWAFVQELNNYPEKYLPDKVADVQQHDDHSNDSDSWGTDFEDEMPEENSRVENVQKEVVKPSQIKGKQAFLLNNNSRMPMPEQEETYVNCESCQDDEDNMYENFQEAKPPPPKNMSKLHNEIQKTLAAKELKSKNELLTGKPTISPKPETLPPKKVAVVYSDRKSPQKSFLHNPPKINQCVPKEITKRMVMPPPLDPKKNKDAEIRKSEKELPRPPAIIRNFDLVKDLPAQTEDSGDDEYEPFEDNVIEQSLKKGITRVDSKLSLQSKSSRQGSVESIYKPPSAASHEEEEQEYDIYECITEMPEDSGYLSPIQRTSNMQPPPPLPFKPVTPPLTPLNQRMKFQAQLKERSPEKKSATLPHSGSNILLPNERATRPLPPPPERQSYTDKLWFHNVTREQANTLIKDPSTYNNPLNGYFLMRPSMTNVDNPLTLVLWYNDRVYNVPVRRRSDNRYALGSQKINEQSFSTIEEIVTFYMREELVLHTGGMQTGSTKLTDTPPK